MGWLFLIPAFAGVWRYRYWAFWKSVIWVFVVLQITALLFSASGEYPDIRGDGLITGSIRWMTKDGPAVLFCLVGIIIGIAICGWILAAARRAAQPPNPGAQSAKQVPTVQKALESFGLVIAVVAASVAVGSINNTWAHAIAPELFAGRSDGASAPPTVEAQLQEAAQSLRPNLPQKLDDATTLSAVDVDGSRFIYRYDLTIEVSAERLREFFNQSNLPKACADADIRAAMSEGASFGYAYTTSSGRQQIFTLEPRACASGRAIEEPGR